MGHICPADAGQVLGLSRTKINLDFEMNYVVVVLMGVERGWRKWKNACVSAKAEDGTQIVWIPCKNFPAAPRAVVLKP